MATTTRSRSHTSHSRTQTRSRKRKSTTVVGPRNLAGAAAVALAAGAAYFFRYELMAMIGYQPVQIADAVRNQLPIAKDLPTIPDVEGNYDIDGVSFDTEGVVISSDLHTDPPSFGY